MEARRNSKSSYKLNWIRSVEGRGHHVGWKVLAACDSWAEVLDVERQMIGVERLRAECALTNVTGGGEGFFNPTPELRARFKAAQNDPDTQTRRSTSNRTAHAKPAVKERHRAGVITALHRPGVQEKIHTLESNKKRSVSGILAQNRPEVKAVISAHSLRAWSRPGERERRSELARVAHTRPEVKAAQSAASKRMWAARKAAGFKWPTEWVYER
jgi:hypothetical protein